MLGVLHSRDTSRIELFETAKTSQTQKIPWNIPCNYRVRQMKDTERDFTAIYSTICYVVNSKFKFVDETLKCGH